LAAVGGWVVVGSWAAVGGGLVSGE
jgi:hypothetical protein